VGADGFAWDGWVVDGLGHGTDLGVRRVEVADGGLGLELDLPFLVGLALSGALEQGSDFLALGRRKVVVVLMILEQLPKDGAALVDGQGVDLVHDPLDVLDRGQAFRAVALLLDEV